MAQRRPAIEATGTQVAFVHMGNDDQARELFAAHGLDSVPRVSDPEATLYRAFGLQRGTVAQVIGPAVWTRGLAALLGGHGIGQPIGDPFQMPGVFLVQDGVLVKTFRHQSIGERPDYVDLATCPLPGPRA